MAIVWYVCVLYCIYFIFYVYTQIHKYTCIPDGIYPIRIVNNNFDDNNNIIINNIKCKHTMGLKLSINIVYIYIYIYISFLRNNDGKQNQVKQ